MQTFKTLMLTFLKFFNSVKHVRFFAVGPSLEIISDTEFISDTDSKIKKEGSKSKSKRKLNETNSKQKTKLKSEKDSKPGAKVKEEKKKTGESLLDLLELEMRARAIRALIRKEDDPIPSNSKEKAVTVSNSSTLSERQANLKEQLEKIDILMKAGDDEDVLIVVPQAPTINLLSSDEETEEKKKKKTADVKSSEAGKTPEKPKEVSEDEIRSTTPPLLPPKIIAQKKEEEKKESPKKPKKDKKDKKKKEKKNQRLSEKFDDLNKASKKVITVDSDLATQNQNLIVQIKNDKIKSVVKPKADVPTEKVPEPTARESSPESDILDDKAIDNEIIINLDDYPDDESTESTPNKNEKLEGSEKSKSETWASRYMQQEEVQNVIKESKIQSEIRKRLRERQRLKKANNSPKIPDEKDNMEGAKTLGSVEEYLALKGVMGKSDFKNIEKTEENNQIDDSKDSFEKLEKVDNKEKETDEVEKQTGDDLPSPKKEEIINKIDEKEVSDNLSSSEVDNNDILKISEPEKCDNILNEKNANLNVKSGVLEEINIASETSDKVIGSTDEDLMFPKTICEKDSVVKTETEQPVLDAKMIESIPKKERIVIKIDKKMTDEVKETSDNLTTEIPEETKFASKTSCVLKSPKSITMPENILQEERAVKKLNDETEKQSDTLKNENLEGIKIVLKIDNSEKSPKLTRVVSSIPKEKKIDDNSKSPKCANLETEGIKIAFKTSESLKSPESLKMIESIPGEESMDNLKSPKSSKEEKTNVDLRSPKSSASKTEISEKIKIAFKIDKSEKSSEEERTEFKDEDKNETPPLKKPKIDFLKEEEEEKTEERKNELKLKLKIESPPKIEKPKVEKIIIKIDKKDEGEKSEYKIGTPNNAMSVMEGLIIECKNLSKDAAILEKTLSPSPKSKRKNSESGKMMIVESIRDTDVEKSLPGKSKKVSQVKIKKIEKLENEEEEPKIRKSSRIRKTRQT